MEILEDSHIWKIKNEEYFPEEILTSIKEIKAKLVKFIENGYVIKNYTDTDADYRKLRKLALAVQKFGSIVDAMVYSGYFHYFGGNKMGKILVNLENNRNRDIPTAQTNIKKSLLCRRILSLIEKDSWGSVKTWNHFNKHLYGEKWEEMARFLKKYTIDEYISQLHLILDETGSLKDNFWELFIESVGEDEIRNLYVLIQNGFYEEDGIYSWHEFLYSVMKDWFLKERRWTFSFNNPLNALFFRSTEFSNFYFSNNINGIHGLWSFKAKANY